MSLKKMNLKISSDLSETEQSNVERVDIMAEDGRELFSISMKEDGTIEVSAGMTAKFDGVMYDSKILVSPRASNVIEVQRKEYK